MATFGLIGSSAPRIRRLRSEPVDSMMYAPELPQMQIGPLQRRIAKADDMLRTPQGPAPAPAEEPAKPQQTPPMGMFGSSAPKTSTYASGKRDWWQEISSDPLGFFLTGTDGLSQKREEALMAEAAAAAKAEADAQRRQMIEQAQAAGLSGRELIAYLTNPQEYGKSLSSNYEAANVSGGDSRVYGDGRTYTAPKFGVDGGYGYTQGPDGVAWGDQRPMSHSEQTQADQINMPVIQNTGQAIVATNRDGSGTRVLYRDPQNAGSQSRYADVSPEEMQRRGYAPGTVGQINLATGEIEVKARPSTQQTGLPTEGERNAGMHVGVSLNGLQNITRMEGNGYNRAGFGEQFSTLFGENEKLYDQAAAEFIDGYLRAMTGAAATSTEIDTYRKQWFPQFGDNPNVVKQKAAGRLNAIQAMKSKAGRSWNPAWDSIIGQLAAQVGDAADGVAPPPSAPASASDMSDDELLAILGQ